MGQIQSNDERSYRKSVSIYHSVYSDNGLGQISNKEQNFYKQYNLIESLKPSLTEQVIYSKKSDFEEIGQHYGGSHFKILNAKTGKFVLMKFLSRARIYTTMLESYLDIFLGRENAHLVTLINYNKTDQGYELFFNYPEMNTLNNYMKHRKIIEEQKVVFIVHKILKGLEFIHSKKKCHGNLDKNNVLIYKDGRVKILDFGTTKLVNKQLYLNLENESQNYSPENIKSTNFTQQGDVWNLGLLVYEMVTRNELFDQKKPNLKTEILNFKVDKLKFEKHVNLFAQDFIKCCLQEKPHLRKSVYQLLNHPYVKNVYLFSDDKSLISESIVPETFTDMFTDENDKKNFKKFYLEYQRGQLDNQNLAQMNQRQNSIYNRLLSSNTTITTIGQKEQQKDLDFSDMRLEMENLRLDQLIINEYQTKN